MAHSYSYLISLMTWSFSRLRTYEDCKYCFFLRYILREEEQKHFYSEFGTLIHEILADYYGDRINKDEARIRYMTRFVLDLPQEVKPSTADNYYEQGKAYVASLVKPQEKIVGIEEKIDFKVGGYPFTGFIDLLLEGRDGLIIQDHKSHVLKRNTKKQKEEFDSFARQLYLYSAGIEQQYGQLPKKIRFNCFRDGIILDEEFDREKYERAKAWAVDTIHRIEKEDSWRPCIDWFRCKYICGFSETCELEVIAS